MVETLLIISLGCAVVAMVVTVVASVLKVYVTMRKVRWRHVPR